MQRPQFSLLTTGSRSMYRLIKDLIPLREAKYRTTIAVINPKNNEWVNAPVGY